MDFLMLQIAENHFVNGNKVKPPYPENHERLIVGMGCFWGAERMFWQQEGVYSTSVGYSAGKTTDPTYNEVCSGVTDHAEVVLIVYDTEKINLNSLLAIFWEGHNPTQFMRQGNDIGTQYRSIIFYDEDETRQRIESSRDQYQSELEKAGYGKIVTEIQSSKKFFYAEDYHQQYLAKNPSGYCGLGGTGIKCSVAG
ncbi:peptide-methionine (S)-S-oxide reductase MsrA [Gammaproteobacteria bacterium]|nr:peptide-methionine (S)-S-oxide reductase MsrA [Gammaproteobacteria bacterium]